MAIRILIFTAPFGDGHRSASGAIGNYLRKRYNGSVEAEVVDYFETFTPKSTRLAAALYQNVSAYWPSGWKIFFNATHRLSPITLFQPVNLIGMKAAEKFLKDYRPDIVISTYPTCTQVAGELKRSLGYLSATVITDFGVHNLWVHHDTDLYFVAADATKGRLTSEGIPSECIEASGIPVKDSFILKQDSGEVRKRYGIKDGFTVLLTCGGSGIGWMYNLCSDLAHLHLQLLVICGKNKKLFLQVRELSKTFRNIFPFGFVEPEMMADLMTISDLMIGKAGGLTVSEALCKGLPMLLYRPIPGQESFNADFLVKNGAALLAGDKADVVEKTAFLTESPERIEILRTNAVLLGKPAAARDISERVLKEVV
jgi:processive 1,2-diacylglycerol beta-glucosyltransferase